MTKVLIVDDNEGDQFLNKTLLTSFYDDIEIHAAYDGEEAIEVLNSGVDIDVILLDINMPGMNGHEFLENYFSDKDVDIPVVIMLTSSDQEKDKAQTQKYKNVKDYCVKPLRKEYIQKIVDIAKKERGIA